PEANEHELVLQIISQGQKSASGDTKNLLDEMKSTVETHRDHAKALLKSLRFEGTAVGGGPTTQGDPYGRGEIDRGPAGGRDGGAHMWGHSANRSTTDMSKPSTGPAPDYNGRSPKPNSLSQ
ncbi:MAG TPA: hypothetical protein VGL13_11830, partial [Polyangiaceae bacterium]